ncbi:MAG TPA: hypothetical protein VMN60_05000 [Longimicrobiales bacterium]|nr:hypothetical protein [Longimicrobiales bacterium]
MTRHEGYSKRWHAAIAALTLIVIFVTPLRADEPHALRDFGAWYGCWEPVPADEGGDLFVCILPAADAASVRMLTIANDSVTDESVLHADGVARPVSEGGCTGTETASWSSDARRIFVRTELDCGPVRRIATSVLGFINISEFIDAQAVTVSGEHAGRAVRYRAVGADRIPAIVAAALAGDRRLAAETARLDAAMPLGIDAVIEAAARVAPPALEALLAAREHGFALDRRTLVQLERGGVSKSVLNVMIALSYPQRFAVQEQAHATTMYRGADGRSDDRRLYDCWDPYFRTWRDCSYYPYYDRYGYRSRYGYYGYDRHDYRYDRYRYGYTGSPWLPGWHNSPVVVIVRDDGELYTPGQVIRGQGYTSGNSPRTGSAQPRSGAGTTTSSGGRSTSGSTTSTSSGSSTGTSTGRTAVPRPGGGGDDPAPPPIAQQQQQRVQAPALQPRTAQPRTQPPPVQQPVQERVQPPAPPVQRPAAQQRVERPAPPVQPPAAQHRVERPAPPAQPPAAQQRVQTPAPPAQQPVQRRTEPPPPAPPREDPPAAPPGGRTAVTRPAGGGAP